MIGMAHARWSFLILSIDNNNSIIVFQCIYYISSLTLSFPATLIAASLIIFLVVTEIAYYRTVSTYTGDAVMWQYKATPKKTYRWFWSDNWCKSLLIAIKRHSCRLAPVDALNVVQIGYYIMNIAHPLTHVRLTSSMPTKSTQKCMGKLASANCAILTADSDMNMTIDITIKMDCKRKSCYW